MAPWVVVIANSSRLDANNLIRGGQGCIVDVEAGLEGLLSRFKSAREIHDASKGNDTLCEVDGYTGTLYKCQMMLVLTSNYYSN